MLQRLRVPTRRSSEFIDITAELQKIVQASGVQAGMLFLYCPHTSCGLTIQENADPGVPHDMLLLLHRLAPHQDPEYRHNEDNSPSHLQTALMGVSQFLFIEDGNLLLGRWQAVFLCEFDGPRERTLLLRIQADD